MSDPIPPDEPEDQDTAAAARLTVSPQLFAALEDTLLGQRPHLTRSDVVARTGVSVERAHDLWLSLGFPPPESDDAVMFVDDDVTALGILQGLVDIGLIDEEREAALSRSLGRSFARLAEWEVTELAESLLAQLPEHQAGSPDPALVLDMTRQLLTQVEELHSYVWRRHLAGAAGRLLLQASSEEAEGLTVGFADVVGYTRRTRSMSSDELGTMVERFESTATSKVSDHGGRIIKTIGDEVLFVADEPAAAARIALALAEEHDLDETFPQVRVGLGHGEVLQRFGDVFGEPVNIASRLTSLARPGRVLINRTLADLLREEGDEFRVRRWRVVPVKGYTRLEAWTLKRPKRSGETPDGPLEALEALADRLVGRGEITRDDPAATPGEH